MKQWLSDDQTVTKIVEKASKATQKLRLPFLNAHKMRVQNDLNVEPVVARV